MKTQAARTASRVPPRQRGASMLVVLVILTVMLLSGLTMARFSEVSTLAAGNLAYKEASVQASEVGINVAFDALKALGSEEANNGAWYLALMSDQDANGLPTAANWDNAPEQAVGAYKVRYVVERMCTGALPVTNVNRQCLLKQAASTGSAKAGAEPLDPPSAKQFRATVRVMGPKGTMTFVQSLMTKG